MQVCIAISARLEGVSRADVLEFLGDLGGCSVQLLSDTLLFGHVHRVEHLTQITVNHALQTDGME